MGCSQGSSDLLSKRSLPYARALRETTDDPNALGGIFVAPLLKGSQIRTVPLPDCARREPRRVARTRTPSIEKSCWALEVRQVQGGHDGEEHKHDWKLPVPTQDKNVLFGLVRLHLEKSTFSAPIRKLSLEVIPVKPRLAQGNLFAPPSPEPEKLQLTLERRCPWILLLSSKVVRL